MILIIDNGSQYTHLIKRTCRDLGYDSETIYAKADIKLFEDYVKRGISKIIISGGPNSVYNDQDSVGANVCAKIRDSKLKTPLLGICYGHQMIAHIWGAKVARGTSAEYGLGEVLIDDKDMIFKGIPRKLKVWASHYDEVKEVPNGFVKLAHSEICAIEAMRHQKLPIFSVQFHPEVWHTEHGEDIIKNFIEGTNELGGI
ncbi:GMP synthase subunit A [Candidatus Micrarchaeota archaeon]|nr:GMP synthase subunit A [Candidatus Micrarchaeota archaeon]MBU1166500.1 GMP synthase subunit A [Candidatus Micrarchaeota archaeon]MBU1887512.1 GMP synthase subunit A [Candidatus Micrarchaeota archaeon]